MLDCRRECITCKYTFMMLHNANAHGYIYINTLCWSWNHVLFICGTWLPQTISISPCHFLFGFRETKGRSPMPLVICICCEGFRFSYFSWGHWYASVPERELLWEGRLGCARCAGEPSLGSFYFRLGCWFPTGHGTVALQRAIQRRHVQERWCGGSLLTR